MAQTYSELFPPKPELRKLVTQDAIETSTEDRRKAAPLLVIGLEEYIETLLEDLKDRVGALEEAAEAPSDG